MRRWRRHKGAASGPRRISNLGQLAAHNGDDATARTYFDAAIELGMVDAIEYAGSVLARRL